VAYYRTTLGDIVTVHPDAQANRGGYVATTSVLTGRPYWTAAPYRTALRISRVPKQCVTNWCTAPYLYTSTVRGHAREWRRGRD
jgi:hypothetical protein